MDRPGTQRLADLLVSAAAAEAFSAGLLASASELGVEVLGVGPIELPVSVEQAQAICEVSRPAHHGQGERTVLDRRVRDTWEVPRKLVKVDQRRFDRTLAPSLERLGEELGIPTGRGLRAELHAMLVYGPGQFFAPHQDSEKHDGMVGTLVVGLPSRFRGGALHIRHRGEQHSYRGSQKSLSLVAFYSDCRHEVKPVNAGYRITLTYNLFLDDPPPVSCVEDLDPELASQLAVCLREHFDSASAPQRLVYLLDHEYTRSGLDGSRLKGSDARRVRLLTVAAAVAESELTLGLADVHEVWSAYEAEPPGRWYRDDEPSVGRMDDYALEEMIDWDTTLDSWIDPRDGRLKPVGRHIADDELCASTPSKELAPYASEYEGNMGNYGNTLDRWYHRGAVVIWRRADSFAVRAEADPEFALDQLSASAKDGDLAGARAAAAAVAPFWAAVAGPIGTKRFLTKALRAANAVQDSETATMLLAPFALERLGRSHIRNLGALAHQYGEAWTASLVAGWSARRGRVHPDGGAVTTEAWLVTLPELCEGCADLGDSGALVARLIVDDSSAWVASRIATERQTASPRRREDALTALGTPLAAILRAAAILDFGDAGEQTAELLCDEAALLGCTVATLRAALAAGTDTNAIQMIARRAITALAARLAHPPRDPDDWSIVLPDGCSCELCRTLREFLADPARTQLQWPLAKAGRRHLHSRIDAAELPVSHHTRRTGRPYTLVLDKQDELFKEDAERRWREEDDLAWLRRSLSR